MTQAVTDDNEAFLFKCGICQSPCRRSDGNHLFGTDAYCMAGSVTVTGSSTTTCFRASSPTSTDGFDSAGASSLAVTTAAGDLVLDVIGVAAGYILLLAVRKLCVGVSSALIAGRFGRRINTVGKRQQHDDGVDIR